MNHTLSLRISNLCLIILFLFSSNSIFAKETTNINDNWKFIKTNVTGAQATSFNDISWETVSIPHTWNAFDGEDGGNNYYRGIGWYRKHIVIPLTSGDKVIYLRFSAVSTKAVVYLNGTMVGMHFGGYGAFMFDITGKVLPGQDNVIAVQVDNSSGILCPPLSADFNHDGGITRNVDLITANQLHINSNEYISNKFTLNGGIWVAQPGVIIKQSNVSETSAGLMIITKIKNTASTAQNATVEMNLLNAAGQIVKTLTDTKTIAANDTLSSRVSTTIDNPHLWDGLNDPYLYRLEVNLRVNGITVDNSIQPVGFRYFNIDVNKGFFLNGKSYPLRGVSLHESKIDKGHAVSDADRKEAIDLLRETGLNFFRLSHYEHGDFTYNYLDSLGIICWTEIPNVNSVGSTTADNITYTGNAVTNMYELLRQQYNHPSVITWGISNEIDYLSTISPVWTDSILNQVVKSEDTSRPTTLAAMGADKTVNMVPDMFSNNRYDGWYSGTISGFASAMDGLHAMYPKKIIGVSEYGAGANPLQHEYPSALPATGGPWHPEEYQNLFHEQYLKAINARPYFWSTSLWIGIDFAVDARNEGLHPGINDKGIINFDRTIKKDAFYWYKANWNKKETFVYISSRRYLNRPSVINPVRIYSNCDSVSVTVNAKKIKTITSTDHIFMFDSIQMKSGVNHIVAFGFKNNVICKDSVDWTCVESGSIPDFPDVQAGTIQINFQTSAASTPAGYLKDTGLAFANRGNGYSYGWNTDNTANSRERSVATDKRFDTFIHMQVGGTFSWSVTLPNHLYRVSIASGDPGYTDSYHKIQSNGVTVIDFIPTNSFKYGVGTAFVNVTNGTLVVQPANGSVNAKIDFIHITPVDTTMTALNDIQPENFRFFVNAGNLVVQTKGCSLGQIQVFNITGQLILSQPITGDSKQIPVGQLPHGIYVVRINSGLECIQSKIIV